MTKRLLAVTTLLFAATTVSAQGYKYLTSVAAFKVAPGKDSAFVEKGKAFTAPLDKLMAAGVVLAYGMDVDMLHVPGETNVAFWVTVPNYEALATEENAIQEFIRANPGLMADLTSMTDMSSHHDLIVRTREEGHTSVPAGAQPIADFDIQQVKPGRMQDFMTLFKKYDKPVFDKLVADGVIYAWAVDTEAVHTTTPGLVWTIVTMPNLGTKDKVNAAFDEAEKKLSDGERDLIEKSYLDIVDASAHRDSLSISVVYKVK
jgi:hypothetical protein